jgi:hypothetical protein
MSVGQVRAQLGITLPADLYRRLEAAAERLSTDRRRISKQDIVRDCLREHLLIIEAARRR